jgi:hypothetical protein
LDLKVEVEVGYEVVEHIVIDVLLFKIKFKKQKNNSRLTYKGKLFIDVSMGHLTSIFLIFGVLVCC